MTSVYMVWEGGGDLRAIFADEAEAVAYAKECHESFVEAKGHLLGPKDLPRTPQKVRRYTVDRYDLPCIEGDAIEEVWPPEAGPMEGEK